jgi:lauroyl/myristoyl acyltransferase
MLAALAYATADLLVRALPERWSDHAARAVARVAHSARVPARRALETNLTLLRPLDRERLQQRSRQTFEQFALVVTDFLRLARVSAEELGTRVEVHGVEHLECVRRAGRGCVLVSLHAGCWEWGAAFLATHGVPMRILARPHASPQVESFFRRRRATWGVRRLDGAPVWLEAARALRRNEWVAVMGDRSVPELRGSLCAWAGALARRTGAALLPVAMTRLGGGRHALWCDAPIAPSAGLEGGIRAALLRHLDRAPGQWYAFAPLPEGLA